VQENRVIESDAAKGSKDKIAKLPLANITSALLSGFGVGLPTAA